MGLPVAEIIDLREFTQEFTNTIIVRDVPSPPWNDTSEGWALGQADGNTRGGGYFYSVYDQIRDRTTFYNTQAKQENGGAQIILRQAVYSKDTLCRNASVGWWRDALDVYANQTTYRFKAGQPNLQTGQQKLYWYTFGFNHFEIDPLTGNPGSTNIWPNMSDTDMISSNQVAVTGEEGFWIGDDGVNGNQQPFQPVIFEGITDTSGYDQETNASAGILRGGTTHAKGLALMNCQRANFVGGGTGNNTGRRWVWIDIDTGLAVGVLGIESTANSNSTNTFAGPSVDGHAFNWTRVQFVPDEGSTFDQPKGELHIFTGLSSTFEFLNREIDAPEQTFNSTVCRNYVQVYDFNPFGQIGGTVRVHNRIIFTGLYDIPQEPLIEGGGDMDDSDDGVQRRATTIIYHPPSRTYCVAVGRSNGNPWDGPDEPEVGNSRLIRFRRQSVVDRLSQPTPTSAVTEQRTINARVIASNDLGSRATGVTMFFELFRVSTRDEQFDGTAQGGGNYVVAQGEIDNDGHLEVYEGGGIDTGGTLLVDGVDYTVSSFATGTLAPVGSWPTDTISVRYRHRAVQATPAHGTLLNATGATDGNGQAFAQIRYDDDLEGELDELEATA